MEEKYSIGRVKKTFGSFTFRVEGYSALSTRVGESIESPEFSLCGYKWQLRIFPGGSLEVHSGNVSFYLASKSTVVARASYKLIILSQVIGGIDEYFASSGVRVFEPKGVQVDGWGRDKFLSISYLMDPSNNLFVDDCVMFKVEVCVIGDLETECAASGPKDRPGTLDECMKELLLSSRFADITFNVSGQVMSAHRCILCSRSLVFDAMMQSDMCERSSGVIVIDDIDPLVMKEFLYFIYTGSLTDKTILDKHCTELLAVASKYQVHILIVICEEHICAKINRLNVFEYLAIGDVYGSSRIKTKAFQTISLNYHYFKNVKNLDGIRIDELDTTLQKEINQVIDMADRRHGCCGIESERRFGGGCVIV